jgi:glutamyl-tRNA synthetase
VSVVTRYAPSPTGDLHIGGARTALFSWAFARHSGGRFLLRFEDTDRARSKQEYEHSILEAFTWLGIDHDPVTAEQPIPRQSERVERYAERVAPLLERGAAYRCTCTTADLEGMRERARAEGRARLGYDGSCRDRGIGPDPGLPFCVRLRVPEDGRTRWNDEIAGPSGEDASQIEDFVLVRTDGTPVYHLAVVVDDHEMGVTHVIRGREHLLSTPRQLLIYDALALEPPAFAHVPLLVGPSGKKLSKREAAVSVLGYRDRGFTSESVLNFLARLGWGHGDLEVFDMETFVSLFTLEGVGKSPSQVQEDKLLALSQHWLGELSAERLQREVQPFLDAAAGRAVEIDAGLAELLELLRPRSSTLVDMAERARFYWLDEVELDPKAARKHLSEKAAEPLTTLRRALGECSDWTADALELVFESVCASRDLKMGQLAQPTRVAVTGSAASPGIFETLALLGRERSLARIDAALARL